VIYIFDNYTLDGDKRELRDGEVVVQLQPQVFDLLEFLLRNRDRVVSKDEMLAAVWGGRIVSESTLASRINHHCSARLSFEDRLRRSCCHDGDYRCAVRPAYRRDPRVHDLP
jgi:DNA-binding winged helix-turn-helix (wHTH) protein